MSALHVGNLLIDDIDVAIAQMRTGACLCGRRNDVRYGPALWGYGPTCRRCRKAWTEKHGKRWHGPRYPKRKRAAGSSDERQGSAHRHAFTALWWHFGPYGDQTVHVSGGGGGGGET